MIQLRIEVTFTQVQAMLNFYKLDLKNWHSLAIWSIEVQRFFKILSAFLKVTYPHITLGPNWNAIRILEFLIWRYKKWIFFKRKAH